LKKEQIGFHFEGILSILKFEPSFFTTGKFNIFFLSTVDNDVVYNGFTVPCLGAGVASLKKIALLPYRFYFSRRFWLKIQIENSAA